MEWSLITLGIISNVLGFLLRPVFWYLAKGKKQKVSPISDPILTIPATTLAEKIIKKELTSERVVQTYINRVKEVNPLINAVVQDRYEAALEEARGVDAFLKDTELPIEELLRQKPLLGVPLTVKECCGVKGMKMTLGSLHRIDEIAKENGESIYLLKRAGAIPILVSNTPEYCLSWESVNNVTGRSKNPYDTTRSVGGSSGGEGALLGAGASIIGVGSDLGGSIRIPSMFNGVFGHKPTQGIISTKYMLPEQNNAEINEKLLTVGPMCRYAKDLTVMMKVMTGNAGEKLGFDEDIDLSKLEVFFMVNASNCLYQVSVQKEVRRAIKKAVAHMRDECKSRVNNTKFPGLSDGFLISTPGLLLYDFNNPDIDSGVENRSEFNPNSEMVKLMKGNSKHSFPLVFLHSNIQLSKKLFGKRTDEFRARGEKLRKEMISKLGSNGILLYPNFPVSATRHGEFVVTSMGLMYTMVFNVLGFPSTSVPMGLDNNGLPIGLQVIAGPNQDKLCIAVAKELSKIGGWVPPSS